MSAGRLTLRTQLTLLYAGPFLLVGATVLTVPLLGIKQSAPVGSGREPTVEADFPFGTWALSLAALVVVAVVIGWLVAGRFLRPLRLMTGTAREISATNLHRRLGSTGGTDELAELAATLDDLFTRLEAAFASQRNFVANASHELRTPLAAERTVLQVALADQAPTVESLQAACQEVLDLGAGQERLIDALLTLAVGEQGVERRDVFDLAEIADRVISSLDCDGVGIWAPVSLSSDLRPAPMSGDADLVQILVTNLVDNAVRHNIPGGLVHVVTTTVSGDARLDVANSGPVIPPDEVDRLFQPFQQLQRQRTAHSGGHGLGLAIVRAVADAHGAHLTALALPAGGLDVSVTFAESPPIPPRPRS